MQKGKTPIDAVAATLKELRGAFALAFLFAGEDDLLIGARKGSPLAVGYGKGEMYLGSDAIALSPFTDTISYLDDGDWVVLTHTSASVRDAQDREVKRPIVKSSVSAQLVDKGNHKHFMAKEIHEQPEVVGHTLAHYITWSENVSPCRKLPFDWTKLKRLSISACGTAFYAGLVAKYWFERFAKLPVEIDIALRIPLPRRAARRGRSSAVHLAVGRDRRYAGDFALRQGDEAARTLRGQRHNIDHRARKRRGDATLAGPEIGVASTKAFTCQLSVLACLALAAGRARGHLSETDEKNLVRALIAVPRLMSQALALEPQIEKLVARLAKVKDVLYLGRGTSFPIALEGALKLKEIS